MENRSDVLDLFKRLGYQMHPQLPPYVFPAFNVSTLVKWLVSVITLLFAFVGLCFYFKVCFIIVKLKSTHFVNPFYTLVLYLAFADCLLLFIQTVGCFFPLIGFFNVPVYFVIVLGFLEQVALYSLSILIGVLGINRYISVCHSIRYKTWFSQRQAHALGCLSLMIGCLLPTPDYYCACYSFKAGFSWKFGCSFTSISCVMFAAKFDEYVSGILTAFVPFINVTTFCHYRWRKYQVARSLHREVKIEKGDLKMLTQFIIISLIFIAYWTVFWVQNLNNNSDIGDVALTLLSILNSSINPYLYAIFSSEIRAKLFKSKTTKVTSISTKTSVLVITGQK